ncbi:MAG: VIT1/CCC1 transporter family protein [Candidatus Liptonbacteria bacterium]|nr:VIT1/CCC1 transporter family protein [Candidatus Liptonbacteria bacterium]
MQTGNKINNSVPTKLAHNLVLNEVFDLALYKRIAEFASGETKAMLEKLIEVETEHVKFWQSFFNLPLNKLDFGRRVKFLFLVFFARVFGERGIHLLLEAIEIHGIRNYLSVWEIYKNHPLGGAVRGVLNDEFKHEEEIVSKSVSRKIHPERVRDIFLGLNDGLVEIIGAVSGFFAAFQTTTAVLVASLTVAVAGSISMAAAAFAALNSEREVEDVATRKKRFLDEGNGEFPQTSPASSALVVGISYFLGASVPVLPVLFGAQSIWVSVIAALIVIILISYFVAFLSGVSIIRRITINVVIIAVAVGVTYGAGLLAKNVFGINI